MTGPYGAAALDYFQAGWPGVLPVEGKSLPPRGYTGASGVDTSYADVHTWLGDPEMAVRNIGLRPPPSVIGLDVDAYDGRNGGRTLATLEARWGTLPPTVRSTSRRDGVSGIRFYRVPEGLAFPANLDGIVGGCSHLDIIRRTHRYGMVWPSVHPDTRETYRWLDPDGLLLNGVPKPDDLPPLPGEWVAGITGGQVADEPGEGDGPSGLLSVEDERPRKHTGPIPEGTRHADLVSFAGYLHRLGLPLPLAETLMLKRLQDCAQPPVARTPVTEAEALDKLRDVYTRYEPGRVLVDEPEATVQPTGDAPRRNAPLDWTAVLEGEQPEPDWLAEPVLEAGTSVVIYSPPKAGKSLVTLDICAGLAAGRSVLGNQAREPVRVLYLDMENTQADLGERLRAMGYAPADLGDRLIYISFPSLPALDTAAGGQALLALVHEHRAAVVVIDTLSRFVEGDENEAQTWPRRAAPPVRRSGSASPTPRPATPPPVCGADAT